MSHYDINSNNLNGSKTMNGFAKHLKKPVEVQDSDEILQKVFDASVKAIQNLPKNGSFQLSNELLLKFYGYYKQAVDGPCTRPKPSLFKMVEKAKWDSWSSMKNLSKLEAMNAYVEEIKNIVETMPFNEHVENLQKILGPIYKLDDGNLSEDDDDTDENSNDVDEKQLKTDAEMSQTLTNGSNHINSDVDDDDNNENYCDTSDSIDSSRLNTMKNLKLNGHDDSLGHKHDFNKSLIVQFGGESHQQQNRADAFYAASTSRQQTTNNTTSGNGNASLNNSIRTNSGGGAGGSLPPNENNILNLNYIQQDTSRQILLLLARLQQDTNNVLTRLSYLEATVMSIQNGLQLNRLESTLQASEQKKNSLHTVPSCSHTCSTLQTICQYFRIDWQTVFVAVIVPFAIRLVFYLLRKIRLYFKWKRSKRMI